MSETATAVRPEVELKIVGIEQLAESKTNPRKHFAKDALSDLTKSIAEKGVLNPLLVRQLAGDNVPTGHYEILAGARRYRAAKAAGLKTIPVLVRDLDDEAALELQVIENLQRADVHPLEEAEGYKQLLAKGKYDVETLAGKVGKSVSYIYARLKLAELVPAAKKAFEEEKITAGHAILLARLQPKDQAAALKEGQYHGGEFCSVRDLGDWIRENIHLELKDVPWDLADAVLLPAAGACTTCPKRSGANPQLFADIKAKDTCTDPQCFAAKMEAQFVHIRTELEAKGREIVKITANYQDGNGVLGYGHYRLTAEGTCSELVTGFVVTGGWVNGRTLKRGQLVNVCIERKCKIHWMSESSGAYTYGRDPATKAKERKTRALEAARTLAFVQVVGKVKTWNLNAAALSFAHAVSFERQKLACKALGIWPKDGKTGGFDFRAKLEAAIRAIRKPVDLHRAYAALTLSPAYGNWSSDYYFGGADLKALKTAGKSVGVSVEKLERKFVAEAAAKAKKKKKAKGKAKAKAAKPHTSAKTKKSRKKG